VAALNDVKVVEENPG